MQEKAREQSPSTGSTFKFWGRLRLRVRRRRQFLKEIFNDSGGNFKDTESEDGQNGDTFDLRRMGRGAKNKIFGFAHNWALVGTGRWLRLAGNRFLLKVDARVSFLVKRRRGKPEETEEKALPGLGREGKIHTERRWKLEKPDGPLRIATWVNAKGRSSIRAPLIGSHSGPDEEEKEVAEETEIEDCIAEGCCGCSGGIIWRSRSRREIVEIGESEGQRIEERAVANVDDPAALPDDIVEMCLARTPFASLMRARAVCKKWKSLTLSPHFLQLRESIRPLEPWLFLFGLSRDGVCLGQIQALDPALSRWHTIKADILTGRVSYSVAAVNSVIFVVGGCSSSSPTVSGRSDKDSLKTLKTVLMYTPLTGTWRNVCPLTMERSAPIVGVFKVQGRTSGGESTDGDTVRSRCSSQVKWASNLHSVQSSPSRRRIWERGSRHRGELAVYGGPEARGREVDSLGSTDSNAVEAFVDLENCCRQECCPQVQQAECTEFNFQGRDRTIKYQRRFGLIVVGGQGTWSEQLNSAEIYDPITDNWREISSFPAEHGTPCAGVVCKDFFYVYSETNKLAAYDIEREVWHSIQVSQVPARLLDYIPKLVSCRDRIFLLGVAWGMISDGGFEMATRKIWELHQEPTSTGWVKVSQHPDAPLDWNAVFVADEEKIFGVEMFKIFGQMLDFVTVCKVSGSGAMEWERVSRMEMAVNEMDHSSCLTKTAIVVRL